MSVTIPATTGSGFQRSTHLTNPQSFTKMIWAQFAATPTALSNLIGSQNSGGTSLAALTPVEFNSGKLAVNTGSGGGSDSFATQPTWTDWTCYVLTGTTAGANSLIGGWLDNAGGSFVFLDVTGVAFTNAFDNIGMNAMSVATTVAYYMEWNTVLTPTQIGTQYGSAVPIVATGNLTSYQTFATVSGTDQSATYGGAGTGALTVNGTLTVGATNPGFPTTALTAAGFSGSLGVGSLGTSSVGLMQGLGLSGSYAIALATSQNQLGYGSGSLGIGSLFNASVTARLSALGLSGSLGVGSATAAGAATGLGLSGSIAAAQLTGTSLTHGVGLSGSLSIAALTTINPNLLVGAGLSGSMAIGSLQTIPLPAPPSCVNLWSADGRLNWTADGYPGWSADGYEPTPLQCAVAYLAGVGVNVGLLTYQCSQYGVPVGWVITGYVPFINPAYAGQYIPLTISTGPCPGVTILTVPNLVGLFYYDAQLAILDAGFYIGEPIWGFSASGTVLPQYVYAQSIAAGTEFTQQVQILINVQGFPVVNQPGIVVPVP